MDTAAWWLLTSRLIAETAAWQQARIAEGYHVTTGQPSRAGWPLHATLVLPSVEIATGSPAASDTVAWQTSQARLIYAPWHPTEVTVELDKAQTLQLGAAPPVTLQVELLDLSVPLDQAGQANGILVIARHLRLSLSVGLVGVDALWIKLAPANIHLSLSALTLPGPGLPLGGIIGSVDLQAHSTIALPDQRDPALAAAAWRDAGGQLVISDAALGWGPLDVHGSATFGFDPALQPVGRGSLRVTGYQQAIDALVHSGLVTANNGRVAGTLLSLVSHSGNNNVPEAELPFSLQNGVLSSGAFPLTKFPPLALP